MFETTPQIDTNQTLLLEQTKANKQNLNHI